MTAFDQRADGHERIAAAGFEDAGERRDVSRKRSALVLIGGVLPTPRQAAATVDFRLVQRPPKGEHAPVDVSRLDPATTSA
jgi:hypothetical protein